MNDRSPLAPPRRRRLRPTVVATVRRCAALVIIGLLGLTGAGCETPAEPEASYKPPLLPVVLVVDAEGVRVEGDASIVTPIGQFSIGARYDLPKRDAGTVYVTVRDKNTGFDDIYQVRTGQDEFSAVTNGTTTIAVQDGHVTIDVTAGSVEKIEFKRTEPTAGEAAGNPAEAWWNDTRAGWQAGYDSSFYEPFALAKWAYDDSTIDRWYGIGFVWFLVRLALSIVLGAVDLVLSCVFLLAQVGYMLGGPTGRNIVWGLAVLVVIGFFVLVVSSS